MKKKIINVLLVCLLTTAMAGCGKKGEEESVSENSMSVADEIAVSVSEESIPKEATEYTSITFDIPDFLVADEANTDTEQFYLSNQADNLSYISYIRTDKPENYSDVTREQYEESFLKKYNVEPSIVEFNEVEKEDYVRTEIMVNYAFGNTAFSTTEYIFVTERYVFTVCFTLDKLAANNSITADFEACADTMTLNSVVGSVSDNKVEGVEVSMNSILTEDEVMGMISAGVESNE